MDNDEYISAEIRQQQYQQAIHTMCQRHHCLMQLPRSRIHTLQKTAVMLNAYEGEGRILMRDGTFRHYRDIEGCQ